MLPDDGDRARPHPERRRQHMTDPGSTRGPEDTGLLKRPRFVRRDPSPAEPLMTPTEYRLAETLQNTVDERLENGIRAIEEQATGLMREVATEVWRTSARDVRPEQERIITLLARDQAIRSLIASSDERFQSLAVRTSRLEDHLGDVADSGRQTREAMEASAKAIRDIANSPTLHGVETVRSQLELVERHIAEAFAHMDERDRHLTETVLMQVRDHGELIANETSRIVEAMQSYVQGGAEAVGRLAQRIEEHAQMFIMQDHTLDETMRQVVGEQTADLTEQLELVREKVGLFGRDQDQVRSRIEAMLEARVRGLAELIRSDSQALRRAMQEQIEAATSADTDGSADDATVVRFVDERMMAFEQVLEERMREFERGMSEQVLALSTAMSASVERSMERMSSAPGSVEGLDELVAETQRASEDRLLGHLDDRVTAIARLIRSDNEAIARRIGELAAAHPDESSEPTDVEALKHVVRVVKELEAGMASDVDRRFQVMADQLHHESQTQAETMLKVAEILGEKIDRLSVRMDQGVGNDIQIVVDRMSDAIQAMSSVQRREAS
jgi:hypothetical protein